MAGATAQAHSAVRSKKAPFPRLTFLASGDVVRRSNNLKLGGVQAHHPAGQRPGWGLGQPQWAGAAVLGPFWGPYELRGDLTDAPPAKLAK